MEIKNSPDFKVKRVKSVSLIEIIEIKTILGEGTEDDPIHEQILYWTKEGKLVGSLLIN